MIAYFALRLVVFIVWLCPFWLLYAISACVAWVLFHCGFRRDTVMHNLKYVFPDKSESELLILAKKVYRNFLDVSVVEMLKFFTMSDRVMNQRFIQDKDSKKIIDEAYAVGKDVIAVLGHYANWEWALSAKVNHHPVCFYKPLKNPYLDHYVKKNRERFGFRLESARKPNPTHVFSQPMQHPTIYTLVADKQRMKSRDKGRVIMVDFMGHKASFLAGPAVSAKKKDAALIFVHINRQKAGYYKLSYQLISKDPSNTSVEDLTQSWVKCLEKDIIAAPEQWFWFWALTRR